MAITRHLSGFRRPLVTCLLMAAALTGCEQPGDEPAGSGQDEPASSGLTVSMRVELAQAGDQLRVQGSTNIPDGGLVYFEAMALTHSDVHEGFESGELEVMDGRLETSLDVSGWPSGTVEVLLAFTTLNLSQPPHILALIGDSGEGILGPLATSSGHLGIFPDYTWAEVVETVEIR